MPEAKTPKIIVRRCWAYSLTNKRCDQLAGHEGDHSITESWNDDECLDPNDQPIYVMREPSHGETNTMTALTEHLVEFEPIELKPDCAVCEHPAIHHPNMSACVACDCKNYVG